MSEIDRLLRFHQDALDIRAYRQQLLASNIANADTPGYKARDVDFAKAMQSAMSQQDAPRQLAATSARHIAGAGDAAAAASAGYRVPVQASIDGNTVDMDQERAAFAENSVHYEANLTFINAQLKLLLSAIQG